MKHLPHGTVTALVIILGIFVIYETGSLNKATSIAEDAANHNSEAVLHASKSFEQKIADKDNIINISNTRIASLSRSLAILAAEHESLKVTLALAKTPKDTITAQNSIITNLSQQVDTLNKKCTHATVMISVCEEQKKELWDRIHVLESTLKAQVGSTKCRFLLLFGCLSRTESAEVGAGIGATVVLLLKSIIH